MTRSATKDEGVERCVGGWRLLLQGNEKANGSWTARAGRVGEGQRLHRWMKTRLGPRIRSQELWVSHIFANVRTTKSFSLAALFSTRKSCSVRSLVRTKQPRLRCVRSKKTLSLFLSLSFPPLLLFLEKAPYRFQYIPDELLCVYEHSRLAVFSWISRRTRADAVTMAGKQLRYLGSITSTSVSFNRS